MIVVNGFVSDEVKEKLLAGGTDEVARRHGNLIIAGGFGGMDTGGVKTLTITGNESFTFSSGNKTVYFMYSGLTNVMREDIINVSCTHFAYGDGIVLADMNNGEFIFNCSSTSEGARATGNISFKDTTNFTSKDAAAAWFKAQYANGTPVTITYEVCEWEYVPYLESFGKQAIETKYVVHEDDVLEMDYEITNLEAGSDKFMFGSQAQSSGSGLWCETYGKENKWYVRFGSSSSLNAASTSSQLSGSLKLSKQSFVVNGTSVATPNYVQMPVGTLAIFCRRNASGQYSGGAYMKCHGFRVIRNGETIHDYKPAKKASGELGMYDVETRQFLTNVGSGSFSAE